MQQSYRIVKDRHSANAFDGEGARVNGGRWTSVGIPVVYTAASAALAALEMLVHVDNRRLLGAYVVFTCTFDPQWIESIDVAALPWTWRTYPAPLELQRLGDAWARWGNSAVLRVPSVVIENESNYLLNPRHPDFARIEISDAQPFMFDLRLVR